MRSKPRGPMRDNSKNISVRMTEEQYQRLRRYMALTRLPITTYFRKLIRGDGLRERAFQLQRPLHAGVNMIHSNVMQIARCPCVKELDAEAVAKLRFLEDKLCEEIYLLTAQE